MSRFLVVSLIPLIFCSCAQFRGIPSHGGGKRFDEEQRVLASSIRQTIADIDLSKLRGKRVQIVVTSMATGGAGTTNWSGLQDINIIGSAIERSIFDKDRNLYFSGTRYRPYSSYRATEVRTDQDIKYFTSSMEMHARHQGLILSKTKADYILYVLVDVLGTNRNRRDNFVYRSDKLKASCEATYYAQEVKTGKLLFKAMQTGSAATYIEHHVPLVSKIKVERKIEQGKPLVYASNGLHSRADEPVEIQLDSPKDELEQEKKEKLRKLRNKAQFHIDSKNPDVAREYINIIKELDPGHPDIEDLENELNEK